MPTFLDEATVQTLNKPGRRVSEAVIYYRKENRGPEANWIVTADSQVWKQMFYLQRGWTALPQYGVVARASCEWNSEYKWYPILSHPDGPSEFPVDQILELGWHREGGLPPFPPNAKPFEIFWPQLAGKEIPDFYCPHCESRPFVKAHHMALHLMRTHNVDYATILAMGDAMGIDFSKDIAPKSKRVYSFPTERPGSQVAVQVSGPTVVKAEIPDLALIARAAASAQDGGSVAADAPPKPRRTQTPEQAARSREALAKARMARDAKKAQRLAEESAAPLMTTDESN